MVVVAVAAAVAAGAGSGAGAAIGANVEVGVTVKVAFAGVAVGNVLTHSKCSRQVCMPIQACCEQAETHSLPAQDADEREHEQHCRHLFPQRLDANVHYIALLCCSPVVI